MAGILRPSSVSFLFSAELPKCDPVSNKAPEGFPSDDLKDDDDKESKKESSKQNIIWSEAEDKQLFELYKVRGALWSIIAKSFPGRTENQIKNRFYSTLRRVATKKTADQDLPPRSSIRMSKTELLQYVDYAVDYGHSCFSKRGRKKKNIKENPRETTTKAMTGITKPHLSSRSKRRNNLRPLTVHAKKRSRDESELGHENPQQEIVYPSLPIQKPLALRPILFPGSTRYINPISPSMYTLHNSTMEQQRAQAPIPSPLPPPLPRHLLDPSTVIHQAQLEEIVMMQQSLIGMLLRQNTTLPCTQSRSYENALKR